MPKILVDATDFVLDQKQAAQRRTQTKMPRQKENWPGARKICLPAGTKYAVE
jgi:hypothetical protein